MRINRLFVNINKLPGHSEGGLGKTMNMETGGETLNNTHSHSEVMSNPNLLSIKSQTERRIHSFLGF